MKTLYLFVISALMTSVAMAQEPASNQGYETFEMVRTRNIFDPSRQPMVSSTSATVESTTGGTPSGYVVLTGILESAEKTVAFFSGSRPEYSKVLPVRGEIAGARITKIGSHQIEVERNGKPVVVGIGQTVPFDDSAPTAPPADFLPASDSSPANAANTPSSFTNSTPPTALNPDLQEVARRMMEKRQRELKK